MERTILLGKFPGSPCITTWAQDIRWLDTVLRTLSWKTETVLGSCYRAAMVYFSISLRAKSCAKYAIDEETCCNTSPHTRRMRRVWRRSLSVPTGSSHGQPTLTPI